MVDWGRVRGWVFDLDDTLILERNYVRSGFSALEDEVRRQYAVDGFAAAAWRHFEAGSRGNIFDLALKDLGIEADPGQITGLVKAYRLHDPVIRFEPDAEKILETLSGRFPVAILSDGNWQSQKRKASRLNLQAYASPVVLTDEWGVDFWKPHPRGFKLIQKSFSLLGDAMIYIGDNPAKDFQTPRAMGWQCLRIVRPGGLHAALPCDPSIAAIASFRDLPKGIVP